MRIQTIGFLALLLTASPVFAAEAPPSDASIQELFQVMQTHKLLDGMMGQMDGLLRKSVQQSLAGREVDAGEQKILDDQIAEMNALLQRTLDWQSMEPMYEAIYKKSLSQKEVDDMVAFYKSSSGQAVVMKMPLLLQQSMQMTQEKLAVLMPDIQKIAHETTTRLAAYQASKVNAPAHSTGASK
jgi:hypothetical protein